MAPKGGRGGGGGGGRGGSISSCPDAFQSTTSQVYFANDVVFFVFFLGIALALCSIRKKGGQGKKLIGVPYILALFFFILTYACSIVATVLSQCEVGDSDSIYNWNIAITVFTYLGYWLILFVLVYQLGAMLREQVGKFSLPFKIIYLAVMGVMGALTVSLMGVACYNLWTLTDAGTYRDGDSLFMTAAHFRVAYYVLYMLSVLGAGALALITVLSLRSRSNPAGDLIGWIVTLFVATLVWVCLCIAAAAISISSAYLDFVQSAVILWLTNFFQVLTFIFILCIAKHRCWNKPTPTDQNMLPNPYAPTTQQQQYAYNGQPNSQPYYYQPAPRHDAPEVVR